MFFREMNMERCDFSSSISIIRRYISDDRNMNQIDLLYELFESFLSDSASENFDFDNGLVCRWFKCRIYMRNILVRKSWWHWTERCWKELFRRQK